MPSSKRKINVLIVEDNSELCELYASAFMRDGFSVLTANQGKAALQNYYLKDVDVILLDIMMPEVNGYEVLREIRKYHNQYIPVIMLTNLDASTFSRNDFLDRVDAYLIKTDHKPSEIVEKTKEVLRLNKIMA